METKKPEVTLISHTQEPEKTIAIAVQAWASESFNTSLTDITPEEARKLTKKALLAFHRTALEYVNMTFVIKNVSRAFQQQITRTRHASFSIQSMRMVAKGGFATNGHYTMPPALTSEQQKYFHDYMLDIQTRYGELIAQGFSTENARGILPLNIHSDITITINLNSLYHMLEQRLCLQTQWEFRQVAIQIREEVKNKLGEIFSKPIKAPCIGHDHCVVREFCGVPMYHLKPTAQDEFYKDYESVKNDTNIMFPGGKVK